jgi:hypothetical protein
VTPQCHGHGWRGYGCGFRILYPCLHRDPFPRVRGLTIVIVITSSPTFCHKNASFITLDPILPTWSPIPFPCEPLVERTRLFLVGFPRRPLVSLSLIWPPDTDNAPLTRHRGLPSTCRIQETIPPTCFKHTIDLSHLWHKRKAAPRWRTL